MNNLHSKNNYVPQIQKIINRNKRLPIILNTDYLPENIYKDFVSNLLKIRYEFKLLWKATHKNFELVLDYNFIYLKHEDILFKAGNFNEFWFKYDLYISGFIAGMYN